MFVEESTRIERVRAIFLFGELLVWFGQVAKQRGIIFIFFYFIHIHMEA